MKSKVEILNTIESYWIETDDSGGGQHLMVMKVDCLKAMTEFADQETQQLISRIDNIIKIADKQNEEHQRQISAAVGQIEQLRTENERLKRKIDNLERMRITGSRI